MTDPIPHLRGRKDWANLPHAKFAMLLAWKPSALNTSMFDDIVAYKGFKDRYPLFVHYAFRKPWQRRRAGFLSHIGREEYRRG